MTSQAASSGLVKPSDLHKIAAAKVNQEIDKDLKRQRIQEEEQRKLHDAFMEREIHPDVAERVNAALRTAVEQGLHELMVIRFPSDWCSDRGRAINNDEPQWAKTLEGFAKRAHGYYEEHLEPMGYKVRARVLDYPGGKPGDVGLFLSW
jgi:hypothetical protein